MTSQATATAAPQPRQACIVCGAPTEPRSYAAFAFAECPRCGLAALVEPMSRADYWTSEVTDDHVDESFWIHAKDAYFRRALDIVGGLTEGRRLIDVGGGLGYFAEIALAAGWDAVSLDVSETATALAVNRIGPDRALQRLPEDAERFDAATLWCVVAHTLSPGEVLDTVRAALAPNGVLWLTTPNFTYHKRYAVLRRLLRRPGDFARDEHLIHFTPDSLTRFLESEGFTDVRYHYAGVVRTCLIARGGSPVLVYAKRAWNAAAHLGARLGGPNLMSELQVSCRLRPARAAA